MTRFGEMVAGCVLIGVAAAGAQVVAFSDPSDWMTVPSGHIVMKTQLDTAQLGSKKVELTLHMVQNGKRRRVARKVYKADDFSKEFDLGNVGRKVLGGYDYLSVSWKVPGEKHEGVCEPFGVVDLEKLPKLEPVVVRKIGDGLSGSGLVSAVTGTGTAELGGVTYAFAWNAEALWVACKSGSKGVLEVILDGKNGKNAYLSYPDRILRIVPATDSVHAFHYKRSLRDGAIEYHEETWHHEMSSATADGFVVAGLPWYDTGIIPADNRTVGLGCFVLNGDGAVASSLWKQSQRTIPGTWGDMKLAE